MATAPRPLPRPKHAPCLGGVVRCEKGPACAAMRSFSVFLRPPQHTSKGESEGPNQVLSPLVYGAGYPIFAMIVQNSPNKTTPLSMPTHSAMLIKHSGWFFVVRLHRGAAARRPERRTPAGR